MADQRKVELILGIRTTGAPDAAAGLASISKAAESLKGELTTLQRGDALKDLGVVAAQVAAQTGDLDAAAGRLAQELKAVGATEKEIRKVSKEFERTVSSIEKARAAQEKLGAAMAKDAEKSAAATKTVAKEVLTLDAALGKIGRADEITQLATKWGLVAKNTRDVTAATAKLNAELKRIDATENEIQGAAGAFEGARTGGATNLITRAGQEVRALPSQQTGLGFGTDAIGNVLRLGGALTEAAGKSALTTKAIGVLTPLLGAQAAATAGAAVPIGLFLAGFVALSVAFKAVTDATAQSVDRINTFAESQRSLSDQITSGLTSDEAKKQLEELNTRRKLEADTLNTLQAAYDKSTQQLRQATIGGISLGNAFDNISKIVSQDEQALADQIAKSKEVYESTEGDVVALTAALEDGSLAANDARVAEEELAKERTKNALATADAAGKELQAQQKALNATEEQNKKRLETIEEEKAVAEKQIAVLTESGVTSEEVTNKIAALNDQLGLLGKESEFIKNTGLEASRVADAAKQAAKDAEDAQKKAEQAQEQYTKAVQSATTTYRQSVQDIGTRLKQTLEDNTTKLNRDLASIATKYADEQYDLQIKANRAERDAYQDNLDDIAKIRKDAAKDEQKALIDGDFKELYLSRQARDAALQEEQQTDLKEAQKRKQNQEYALEDLNRTNQRQREQANLAFSQRATDAQLAQNRELQQARTTQNRALAQAASALNAELGLRQQFWNATLKQAQAALGQVGGAKASGANANSPFGAFQSQFKAVMSR